MNNNIDSKIKSFKSLRLLCLFSVIGFIYSMSIDSSNYYTYSNFQTLEIIQDDVTYEIFENKLEQWSNSGIDISEIGIQKISKIYLVRCIIDILALLGVALMYYRIKLGYTIYFIFQITYVISPFILLSSFNAKEIIPLSIMAVNLIYVVLFSTQKKHLI
jgi:hypothetical protein